MDEMLVPSLKLLYKPLEMYYGEWEIKYPLHDIAIIKNGKNMYDEFLNRYYYMPLNVIFHDDKIVHIFDVKICSRIGEKGRSLFFSKRAFLRNLVTNIDELIDANGEGAYKAIKKAIRIKKDIYRDVYNEMENSKYYDYVMGEYLKYQSEDTFEEFVKTCKKQYTRLLNGYNAVMDLFNKPIALDKFINSFDVDKLYLCTCDSILRNNIDYYNKYGKLSYNLKFLDTYKDMVNKIRKKDSFYNISIDKVEKDKIVVYTVDDLFRDLKEVKELYR